MPAKRKPFLDDPTHDYKVPNVLPRPFALFLLALAALGIGIALQGHL